MEPLDLVVCPNVKARSNIVIYERLPRMSGSAWQGKARRRDESVRLEYRNSVFNR
jgi:hypothetical protein